MIKILIAAFIIQISFFSFALEKKAETNESAEEFKESKFIQIDPVDIPEELKVIEDQIAQNSIDVIILSGKHTVVYSQKREEGYNKNFKDFYGLKVSVYPLKNEPGLFGLKLFYYNWITNKFDKSLTKKISKYNVLNELRFAMYELFFGKSFVHDNKDALEKKNFDRIQAVRKMVEEQKKQDKKQTKMKKEQQEKKARDKKNEEESEKLKREERKKKDKNKKEGIATSEIENQVKAKEKGENDIVDEFEGFSIEIGELEKNSPEKPGKKKKKIKNEIKNTVIENELTDPVVSPEPLGTGTFVPKIVEFKFISGISQESIETKGILTVKTNLQYLNLGANYKSEYQTTRPWGHTIAMNAGIPIKKENYQISVSRSLEAGLHGKVIHGLWASIGLEYSSLPFVNLPGPGEGLKVIQNDIVYGKFGVEYSFFLGGRDTNFGAKISKSLSQKSNIEKSIQTKRTSFYLKSDIIGQHGVALSLFKTQIDGQFSGNSSGGTILYSYKFGN